MYQTRSSLSALSSNHRSGNGPLPPLSPNSPRRPLLPLYASFEDWGNRRRYHSRHRLESGLSQMLLSHRSSILNTASLALVGAIQRPSRTLADIEGGRPKDEKRRTPADSFWPRTKQCAQYAYEKSRFKNFLPLLILVGYSFLGGAVVYWVEAPIERLEMEGKQKFLDSQKDLLVQRVWDTREKRYGRTRSLMNLREAVHWYTISTMYLGGNLTRLPPSTTEIVTRVSVLKKYTEEMAQRCWEIRLESSINRTDVKRKVEDSLKLFELFTGVTTEVRPIWTFSNALFLAVTIYTTIGYGSIAPHSTAGRVATIVYAIIGIPVYLMILHKLGRVFLKLLQKLWNLALKFGHYLNCVKSSSTANLNGMGTVDGMSKKAARMKESDSNIPVSLAVGVTFVWMLTCAGVCCLFFETSWDYFTSFYFFFISLTTIGFGDVTPTHPEYMFTMFGLIIVGLSLVSMCINVVQLKLELLFEEMMLTLMEEYEKTGRVMDRDMMMESALFQRGLGVVQMMKLWTRKKRAKQDAAVTFSEVFLPIVAKKRRGAFLRELQRRRHARSVGTQTESWNTASYEHLENLPWMSSSFRRRQLEKLLILHEATQTDPSDYSTIVLAAPSSHLDPNWTLAGANYISSAPDQMEWVRSASSSMITCDDNNSVLASCAVAINAPDEEKKSRNPGPKRVRLAEGSPLAYSEAVRFSSDNENDEATDDEGSKSSCDLIPFIPYIEQEIPPENEQEHPLRRWSAAEAMSVFTNWAASRDLGQRRQSRHSRCSSDGEELEEDEKLARFQNMRKASRRRMTVAVSAPQPSSAPSLRRKQLDHARSRAQGALSAMRIQSGEPSCNDVRTLVNESDGLKVIRQKLTVDNAAGRRKLSEKAAAFV